VKAFAGITVHDYAEKWLEQRHLTPRTLALYKDLLKSRIEPELGGEMLRAVTPAMVRVWWVGLGKETPTRNTHAYQLLKAIFNTAVEDKVVKENPCQVKTAGRPPKPRDVKLLSPAELVKVAELVPEAYRAAVAVAAWCGLRFGELIELRRKDVHTSGDRMVLKIRRAATLIGSKVFVGAPKTKAGVRDVTVPPHVAKGSAGTYEGTYRQGARVVRVHDDAGQEAVPDRIHQGR
jgi:integrase